MSSTPLSAPAPVATDFVLNETSQETQPSVAGRVLGGTGTLALGISLERGAGFAANILAARFAGASTFGAYSLAISTANNVSTYAAGGIGATAARFSGKYAFGSPSYATLSRVLMLVSTVSALLAAGALWLGSAPIANLLHKPALAGLLQWAAISAAGIIMLECARGFFVGQRRLAAVLVLSTIVGAGMLVLLPWTASSHNANRMIFVQGLIPLSAVAFCLLLAGPLHLRSSRSYRFKVPTAPMVREVWGFGVVQLAGLVGANLSGWWLTALVARSDTTLVQMSFFAIASQLRNLAGLAPGLLTEGSYAVMADPQHEHLRTPHRVMAVCSFASTATSLLLATAGMIVMPWLLVRLYGHNYREAALTAAIGLGVAVVHMGNAPAAARLSIVSIHSTAFINTAWAVVVAAAGTILLRHGGSAATAMAVFLAAHVFSAALVLSVLAAKDHVPAGMVTMFLLSTSTTVGLLILAWVRDVSTAAASRIAIAMVCALVTIGCFLWLLGKRYEWLPSPAAVEALKRGVKDGFARLSRRKEGPSHAV